MEYRQIPSIQLTYDTDPGRINRFPCLLRDSVGRLIALYEKSLDTGRISSSRVTHSPDTFNITVEAGEGVVNGQSVVWDEVSLTVEPDSYSLIYVDTDGTVRQTPSASHSHTTNSVLLAYVSSGAHSIVRVEELERTGTYIYFKIQVSGPGDTWVWDDREYRLNSGERPYAVIDRDANKIYLSYIQDRRSMIRVIDITSITPGRNSLEFLPHFSIDSDTIHLDNDPGSSAGVYSGAGLGSVNFSDEIFSFTVPNVTFRRNGSELERVFDLPIIGGDYKDYIKDPVVLTFYSLNRGKYIPEKEVEFTRIETKSMLPSLWLSMGVENTRELYAGITVRHGLYSEAFRTRPSQYTELYIPEEQCTVTTVENNMDLEAREELAHLCSGTGFGSISKLSEEEQDYLTLPVETGSISSGAGVGNFSKTHEYISDTYQAEDTSSTVGSSAGLGQITEL